MTKPRRLRERLSRPVERAAIAAIALFGVAVFGAFLIGVEGWDYANTIAMWMFAGTVVVFVVLGLLMSAAADRQRWRERQVEEVAPGR